MKLALPIDHLAFRVLDRDAALTSLTLLGYEVVTSFDITLDDGSQAQSYALDSPFSPDLFVSSGVEGSKIWRWVQNRGGVGGLHHMAYAVDDVYATMREWTAKGWKFQRPLVCSCPTPLMQVFTEEDPATGLIYEFITRNGHPGFCAENVARLMSESPE